MKKLAKQTNQTNQNCESPSRGPNPSRGFRRSHGRVSPPNTKPSMTEQAHKDDCDIQKILKKYAQTGVITHNNAVQGTYQDFPSGMDFQSAQNIIAEGKSLFETVPARIRADFDNDPAKFLEFTQNPDNRDAMDAYGFLTERKSEPTLTPTVSSKTSVTDDIPPPEASAD